MAVLQQNPFIQQWNANVGAVGLLLAIPRKVGGHGPGRRRNIEVLNKSAIVLTVACWEAFVEDLAGNALNFMIERGQDFQVFPEAVRERVGSKCAGLNELPPKIRLPSEQLG